MDERDGYPDSFERGSVAVMKVEKIWMSSKMGWYWDLEAARPTDSDATSYMGWYGNLEAACPNGLWCNVITQAYKAST